MLREAGGTGGSRAVHASFRIGLHLRCGLPRNDFALHDDGRPAVLIAGGIGITPIKAMAHALKARGCGVQLHYAARSVAEAAYRDELAHEFGSGLRLYAPVDGHRMEVEALLAAAPANALIYACGPHRLIDAVAKAATVLGIDSGRIRVERFAASIGADAKPIEVELRRSGKTLQVPGDQTILDAVLAAGIDAPYSCRAGHCKTCAVRVLEGDPDHRDAALSPGERERDQLMCPCISRAKGGRLALDL